MINTHTVSDAADMRAYNARLRAIPAVLDTAIAESRRSDAAGIRAPRFEIERVIDGSKAIVTGAPSIVARIRRCGRTPRPRSPSSSPRARSRQPRPTPCLPMRARRYCVKPAYDRMIAWAQAELPTAPSGRVGAISLPGGADWYAAALRLNTTLPTSLPSRSTRSALTRSTRIEAEQDALARTAGFKDRDAFYADRARRFPPTPWTDALRADYLARANAAVAHNRSLLPERSTTCRSTAPRSCASPRSAKLPAAPRTRRDRAPTARARAASTSTCSARPRTPPPSTT